MIERSRSCDQKCNEGHLTRRDLLSYALSSAGVAAFTALWPHDSTAASNTGYSAALYFLSVGGIGGPIDSLIDMQQIGTPVPSAQFRIAMGWSVPNPVVEWVASAVARKPIRQSGSIVVTDATLSTRAAYNWSEGFIAQIDLPACDAESATAVSPILTVRAALLTQAAVSGPLAGKWSMGRRGWQQRNFQVTSTAPIGASLSRATRVSGVTLGPNIRGGTFDITMGFGLNRPDLLAPFTSALQHAGALVPDRTTDMMLHLLAADLRTEIAAVVLRNCRVLTVDNPAPATPTAIPKTIVRMGFADAALGFTPA